MCGSCTSCQDDSFSCLVTCNCLKQITFFRAQKMYYDYEPRKSCRQRLYECFLEPLFEEIADFRTSTYSRCSTALTRRLALRKPRSILDFESSMSDATMLGVFAFLRRWQIDGCQLVCKHWFAMIEECADVLPLHPLQHWRLSAFYGCRFNCRVSGTFRRSS